MLHKYLGSSIYGKDRQADGDDYFTVNMHVQYEAFLKRLIKLVFLEMQIHFLQRNPDMKGLNKALIKEMIINIDLR